METKIRNGVKMKKHFESSTWISEDGLYVEKEYKDENGDIKKYSPQIYRDNNGFRYILNKQLGPVFIQDMVITCFCRPRPNDGDDYVICHKDGNYANDNYKNLEWRARMLAFPDTPPNQKDKIEIYKGLYVCKNGEVLQNNKNLPVQYDVYDSDLDLCVPIYGMVRYSYTNKYNREVYQDFFVDRLMDNAGYVTGNKLRHTNPVILHKDNNYKNFDSSNLEWTDISDPRYITYYNKRADEMNDYGLKNNKSYPDFKLIKHI